SGNAEVLAQKNRASFYGLCQQQFGEFAGVVIIHHPKNSPDERHQNNDDVHQRDHGLGKVVVQKKQHHAQQQIKQKIHITPAAAHQIVKTVFQYFKHSSSIKLMQWRVQNRVVRFCFSILKCFL